MIATPAMPPMIWAAMKARTEEGAIPAKLLENMRPMVMAGLAKLVGEVKKYAARCRRPPPPGHKRRHGTTGSGRGIVVTAPS